MALAHVEACVGPLEHNKVHWWLIDLQHGLLTLTSHLTEVGAVSAWEGERGVLGASFGQDAPVRHYSREEGLTAGGGRVNDDGVVTGIEKSSTDALC